MLKCNLLLLDSREISLHSNVLFMKPIGSLLHLIEHYDNIAYLAIKSANLNSKVKTKQISPSQKHSFDHDSYFKSAFLAELQNYRIHVSCWQSYSLLFPSSRLKCDLHQVRSLTFAATAM